MQVSHKVLYKKGDMWLRAIMLIVFFLWLLVKSRNCIRFIIELHFYPYIVHNFFVLILGFLLLFYELLALVTKNNELKIDYTGYLSFVIAVMINTPIVLNFIGKDSFSSMVTGLAVNDLGKYGMVIINALPLIAITLGIGGIIRFCYERAKNKTKEMFISVLGLIFSILGISGACFMIIRWLRFWKEVGSI